MEARSGWDRMNVGEPGTWRTKWALTVIQGEQPLGKQVHRKDSVMTPVAVRRGLVEALKRDRVGPEDAGAGGEHSRVGVHDRSPGRSLAEMPDRAPGEAVVTAIRLPGRSG